MSEERLTWKEAVRRVMIRYSDLAIQRIHACLHGRCDEFMAQSTARECWHYGLLFRDGHIEKTGGRIYDPRKVVYLKKGD